jgi:hypothetical protein
VHIVKLRQIVFVAARPTRGAFEMLEPCEGRLSRTVLRGLGASNGPWLPDARAQRRLYALSVGFVAKALARIRAAAQFCR